LFTVTYVVQFIWPKDVGLIPRVSVFLNLYEKFFLLKNTKEHRFENASIAFLYTKITLNPSEH